MAMIERPEGDRNRKRARAWASEHYDENGWDRATAENAYAKALDEEAPRIEALETVLAKAEAFVHIVTGDKSYWEDVRSEAAEVFAEIRSLLTKETTDD